MSDVKWIKIATDIFNDDKILLIESMPDSDALIVIWFKLLCLAGQQNNSGVFLLNGRIPYTDEMLATIFRRPLNTVRLALATFEQYGMIEIINDTVTIPNWGKHQNLDKIEARNEYMRGYMREYRAKQKAIAGTNKYNEAGLPVNEWKKVLNEFNYECAYCGSKDGIEQDHVKPLDEGGLCEIGNIVPACRRCNASKGKKDVFAWYKQQDFYNEERCNHLRKYIRKSNVSEADKIREDKNRIEYINDYDNVRACACVREDAIPEQAPNAFGDADYRQDTNTIQQYAVNSLKYMGARAMQELGTFLDDLPEPVVRHGLDNALDSGNRTWSYVRAILNSYVDADVKTVQEAVEVDKKHKRQYEKPDNPRPSMAGRKTAAQESDEFWRNVPRF